MCNGGDTKSNHACTFLGRYPLFVYHLISLLQRSIGIVELGMFVLSTVLFACLHTFEVTNVNWAALCYAGLHYVLKPV